jgi:hypothetical protein
MRLTQLVRCLGPYRFQGRHQGLLLLALIILLYLALAVTYSVIVPLWEAPDKPSHFKPLENSPSSAVGLRRRILSIGRLAPHDYGDPNPLGRYQNEAGGLIVAFVSLLNGVERVNLNPHCVTTSRYRGPRDLY